MSSYGVFLLEFSSYRIVLEPSLCEVPDDLAPERGVERDLGELLAAVLLEDGAVHALLRARRLLLADGLEEKTTSHRRVTRLL